MLINNNCPDIFDIVPEHMIGMVREDVGTRKNDRHMQIRKIQQNYGDIGWKEGYFNEGTFVVSRQHKDVFLPHENKYWTGWAGSQSHMSFNIRKFNFEVHDLGYKWNHMTMFSEPWNNNANRLESHVIHYAGNGVFNKGQVANRLEQAKHDFKVLYG
jgi:hypothetical protein